MPENQVGKLFKSAEETLKPEIAQINGKIPAYVNGTFLRTGPGKFDLGQNNFTMNHWLDGFAILSKFTIDQDFVKFEKKFLQSNAYQQAIKNNKPLITEFGTAKCSDPNKGFFGRLVSAVMPVELSDNNQISLFQMGKGKDAATFVSSETSFFRQIEPSTLATGVKYDTNQCFGTNIACAHPLTDPVTGEIYNIGSSVITGTKYNIIRIPPPASNVSPKDMLKKSKIICSIPSSWTGLMSYNHSFFQTQSYIIFCEQPYVMNLAKAAMTYLKNPPHCSYLEWRPELKNRFYVINKQTGKVHKTEFVSKDPFFFLHAIQAYEEDSQIVLDIIAYSDASVLNSMFLSKLRQGDLSQGSYGSCHRYVIPLVNIHDVPENIDLVAVKSSATAIRTGNSIVLTPEIITSEGLELPMTCGGKHKNSYFYAVGSPETEFSNAIVKVDVKKRNHVMWKGSRNHFPGEPIFISNPNNKSEEDDGVLVSAVIDVSENAQDFLLFIDSKTMETLATVKFQSDIPQAVHGLFIHEK